MRAAQLCRCLFMLALAPLLLMPGSAWCAHWQAIDEAASAHVRFYLDAASIRRQGQWHQASLLYDFAEPQFNEDLGTYSKSFVVDSAIDCRGQRLATRRMRMYADNFGRGKAQLQTAPAKTLKWAPAESGPTNRAVIHAVCERVAGTAGKGASH